MKRKGVCMLILTRHRDESIVVGDDIVITVVDIRGDKVRLAIACPVEILVHRQEVWEAIQRENMLAAQAPPTKKAKPGPSSKS
jgi:carbon storage regulator